MPIRVLLADDHRLFRQGLRKLLETEPDIAIVGEADTGSEAIEMAGTLRPDVILMDINMPGASGPAATEAILHDHPEMGVVVLTMFDQDEHLHAALNAGARGYLLKTASSREVTDAVRAVAGGASLLDPVMTAKMLAHYRRMAGGGGAPGGAVLTQKEIAVLRLLAAGHSNKEIARQLSYSESTVKNRLSVVFEKIGVQDRTQAVIYAMQQGILTIDRPAR